jgi:hypothetical protein
MEEAFDLKMLRERIPCLPLADCMILPHHITDLNLSSCLYGKKDIGNGIWCQAAISSIYQCLAALSRWTLIASLTQIIDKGRLFLLPLLR